MTSPFLSWIFVTAQLKCNLKIIGCQVVEVLHSPANRVPAYKCSQRDDFKFITVTRGLAPKDVIVPRVPFKRGDK